MSSVFQSSSILLQEAFRDCLSSVGSLLCFLQSSPCASLVPYPLAPPVQEICMLLPHRSEMHPGQILSLAYWSPFTPVPTRDTSSLDRALDVNQTAFTEFSWVGSSDQDTSLKTSLYVARLQTSQNTWLSGALLPFMSHIPWPEILSNLLNFSGYFNPRLFCKIMPTQRNSYYTCPCETQLGQDLPQVLYIFS